MANRTEELEKLVVEQALEISRLSKVRTKPIRVRERSFEQNKQLLAQVAVIDLTEEVRLLKKKLGDRFETIQNYKEQLIYEVKEINRLKAINNGLSNEKTLETVKYQQELFRSTALKNENDKLKKNENFLIVENAKLNAKIAELESGIIIMDEEDCENPKVAKYSKQRVVAVLTDNYDHFRYCQMLEKEDVRSRTTYVRINHLQQLENRKGYDAIVRSESWTKVVGRDGKYNTNSISDMNEFDAYLSKKTYGF